MKFSIITVCYNSAATILDSVKSVNMQTYPDVEHIIVDGKSADDTLALIGSTPNRVVRAVSEKDRGIYDAMNKGIQMATGDIVGILNSDDLYHDQTVLQKIADAFDDPTVDVVYGDLVYVKKNDTTAVVRKWKSRPYYSSFFEDTHVPPHPSLYLRKHVYEQAGLFDLRFGLAADYEFMLRLFKKFQFKSAYIPVTCIRMRYGGATNKSIGNIIKQNIEILHSWKINGLKAPHFFILKRLSGKLLQFARK